MPQRPSLRRPLHGAEGPAITESPESSENAALTIGKTPLKRNVLFGHVLFWLSVAMIAYILVFV